MAKVRYPKKLIEVALPLNDINEAAAREKSIRHGHPSTLHLWWARRPLAAARAVIFAQMVNDPGSARGYSRGLSKEQAQAKRDELFDIIRDLVKWENTNNEAVLKRAREAIWESWRETCELNKGQPGFDPEKLPAFHDPFAGGGAIPLEAQRLGLESWASDLNPVAVMINKAMIEIPPKFAGRAPVGPENFNAEAQRRRETLTGFEETWPGATGLAEDVRRYGTWMRAEAEKKIGHLYPKIKITAEMTKDRPDLKPYLGQELTVIAWLWARTVKSPNPQFSSVDVPLVSSFILSSKKGKEAYVEPIVEGNTYRFEIRIGTPPAGAENGTKAEGVGADFRCIMSQTAISAEYIRDFGRKHGFKQRLFAIVCDGPRGRIYLPATKEHERIAFGTLPSWRPDSTFCPDALGFRIGNYGMLKWSDVYSDRQTNALNTFFDLIEEVRKDIGQRLQGSCFASDTRGLADGGLGARAYGEAVSLYLTMAVSRITHYWSNLASWHTSGEKMQCVFARQAISMVWDFAECNVFSECSGNWMGGIDWIVEAIAALPANGVGLSRQDDAQTQQISSQKVLVTDPPYYDNIGYADLSDFFYVWLRKGLKSIFPALFASIATPKEEELVATPCRHDGKKNAGIFFLQGMTRAMRNFAMSTHPAFPVSIFYAFKSSDTKENATTNTGWEIFLEAILNAGFQITGTWPMRTEMSGRARDRGANALASSIVLVCRKRSDEAQEISRGEFSRELRKVMFDALQDMTASEGETAAIAPVDLAQAAIGPGMGVYSKYKAVLKSDGTALTVHEAMLEINREIERVLNPDTSLADVDASTRFFLDWFKQHGFVAGPYGEAQTLAQAKGTTTQYVVASGVAESAAGKFRIFHWQEYADDAAYDPRQDANLPLWEACHRVIAALERHNSRAAAQLLARMPEKAEDIHQIAYYLYTYCERKGDAANARVYNTLVTCWDAITQSMAEIGLEEPKPKFEQGELF